MSLAQPSIHSVGTRKRRRILGRTKTERLKARVCVCVPKQNKAICYTCYSPPPALRNERILYRRLRTSFIRISTFGCGSINARNKQHGSICRFVFPFAACVCELKPAQSELSQNDAAYGDEDETISARRLGAVRVVSFVFSLICVRGCSKLHVCTILASICAFSTFPITHRLRSVRHLCAQSRRTHFSVRATAATRF